MNNCALVILLVLSLSQCAVAQLPAIPGHSFVGGGYDAVLDVPRAPVHEFSYADGRVWIDSFNCSRRYSVPDNVTIVRQSSSMVRSRTFRSAHEYMQHRSTSSGVDLKLPFFGMSAESHRVHDYTEGGASFVQLTTEVIAMYSLALSPLMNSSDSFTRDVSKLPRVYDRAAYSEFVSVYGTHFVSEVLLGGYVRLWTATSNNYTSSGSVFAAAANAKLSHAEKSRGAMSGDFFNRNGVGDSFRREKTQETMEFVPSSPSINGSDWRAWLAHTELNPQPLPSHMRLVSLAELIAVTAVRENFRRFVRDYAEENAVPSIELEPLPPSNLDVCECSEQWNDTNSSVMVQAVCTSSGYLTSPATYCRLCHSFRNDFGSAHVPDSDSRPAVISTASNVATCPSRTLLPGIDSYGVGFNAVQGELRVLPIFQLTYVENRTWTNTLNGQVYLVPDQVSVLSGSKEVDDTYTFNNSHAFTEHLAEQVGINGQAPVPGVFFSVSDEAADHNDVFGESQALLVLHTVRTKLYEVLPSSTAKIPLSPGFKALVGTLSATYNYEIYQNFIDKVGTHVVMRASFGGVVDHTVVVDNSYFTTSSERDVRVNVGVQWNAFIGKASFNETNSETFKDFNSRTFSSVLLRGGRALVLTPQEYQEWYSSLSEAPARVATSLEPIERFIDDDTIRANVKMHINTYYQAHVGAKKTSSLAIGAPTSGLVVSASSLSYSNNIAFASCYGDFLVLNRYDSSGEFVNSFTCSQQQPVDKTHFIGVCDYFEPQSDGRCVDGDGTMGVYMGADVYNGWSYYYFMNEFNKKLCAVPCLKQTQLQLLNNVIYPALKGNGAHPSEFKCMQTGDEDKNPVGCNYDGSVRYL